MELAGKAIEVGQKAPDFTAIKQDMSEFSLSDTAGKVRIISVVPRSIPRFAPRKPAFSINRPPRSATCRF